MHYPCSRLEGRHGPPAPPGRQRRRHIRHTLALHQSHQRAESGNAQRGVDTVFCTGILDISVHCSRAHSLGVQQSGGYCWSTPSTENYASHVPSLKAKKPREANAVTAAVSHGNRMTNSIRAFTIPHGPRGLKRQPVQGHAYADTRMFQRCWSVILSGCMRRRATPKPPE
jgi:hypothetical protein